MSSDKPLMRFRLLRGIHSHGDVTYRPGDIIETSTDLAKRFNAPGSIRFERLHDDPAPVTPVVTQLDEILHPTRPEEVLTPRGSSPRSSEGEAVQPVGKRSRQPAGG